MKVVNASNFSATGTPCVVVESHTSIHTDGFGLYSGGLTLRVFSATPDEVDRIRSEILKALQDDEPARPKLVIDDLLLECSAIIKLVAFGPTGQRRFLSEEQEGIVGETLNKIDKARSTTPWHDSKRLFRWLGRRDGIRYAVTWLAARANQMHDAHAKVVLDSAATNLGWDGARLHKSDPYKNQVVTMIHDDMVRAAYDRRMLYYHLPAGQRTLTWDELPGDIKEAEREYLRAAIEAGI